jgi:hypothetical protein
MHVVLSLTVHLRTLLSEESIGNSRIQKISRSFADMYQQDNYIKNVDDVGSIHILATSKSASDRPSCLFKRYGPDLYFPSNFITGPKDMVL